MKRCKIQSILDEGDLNSWMLSEMPMGTRQQHSVRRPLKSDWPVSGFP